MVLRRGFDFEYSLTGNDRYRGAVVIEGRSRFEAAAVVSLVARHPPPDEPSDALARADAFAQLVRSGRLRRIEGNRYALTAPEMGRGAP